MPRKLALAALSVVLLVGGAVLAQGMPAMHAKPAGSLPAQTGQAAFGAIGEIVGMLRADPKTDWTKVDIEALRQHFIDMDELTMHAVIKHDTVKDGERYTATGEGRTRDAIRRMLAMHVAMAGETADWSMSQVPVEGGAQVTVHAKSPTALVRIRALGLIGMMSEGNHHQIHHMMLARGQMGGM